MNVTVYFLGEYERPISRIASLLIDEGDVCIDAGANFGWYTTLMASRCGRSGSVHAFEPVPASFRELQRNCDLSPESEIITINDLALGDRQGTVRINLFADFPTGHASLAAGGKDATSIFDCRMTTLDAYLEENGIASMNFLKADIEGAELLMLEGASSIFRQENLPVILMEMALEQTKNFGYRPNDLISYIRGRADYIFYAVDEVTEKLRMIDGFADDDIGANVFCIPRGQLDERLAPFITR
jgi:FkbM family methyltransferase